MASANLVKIIREALGCSMQEAAQMLEREGANERTLTKREMFAAMAMQGMASSTVIRQRVHEDARQAVMYADALITELAKKPGGGHG